MVNFTNPKLAALYLLFQLNQASPSLWRRKKIRAQLHVLFRHSLDGRYLGIRKSAEESRSSQTKLHSRKMLTDTHLKAISKSREALKVSYIPLEPPPKGMTTSCIILLPFSQRDGAQTSGSGNTCGSRCKVQACVETTVSPGMK